MTTISFLIFVNVSLTIVVITVLVTVRRNMRFMEESLFNLRKEQTLEKVPNGIFEAVSLTECIAQSFDNTPVAKAVGMRSKAITTKDPKSFYIKITVNMEFDFNVPYAVFAEQHKVARKEEFLKFTNEIISGHYMHRVLSQTELTEA